MFRKVVLSLLSMVFFSVFLFTSTPAKSNEKKILTLDQANTALNASNGFFTENKGQWDAEILFVGNTDFGKVAFTHEAIYYRLLKVEPIAEANLEQDFDTKASSFTNSLPDYHPKSKGLSQHSTSAHTVKLSFVDSQEPAVQGKTMLPHYNNYFIGNDPSKWASECHNFAQVTYTEIWDGIDLSYFFSPEGLKYEYYVHPGADIQDLQVQVIGADLLSDQESLELFTPLGSLKDDQLLVYGQETNLPIQASFKVTEDVFSFAIDNNLHADETFVIDPIVYSTFLGGKNQDFAYSVSCDDQSNIYITGDTVSSDFPLSDDANQGNLFDGKLLFYPHVFYCKFNSDNQLIYSTFLGGDFTETGYSIDVDNTGNVVLTGETRSKDFPLKNAFFVKECLYSDAFVTKFNSKGEIVFSTYLGGTSNGGANGDDAGFGVKFGKNNTIFVVGKSTSSNFPITSHSYQPPGKGYGAFITKISHDKIDYSTVFDSKAGGSIAYAVDIDSSGYAVITGTTYGGGFPVKNPFQNEPKGVYEGFVTKLNHEGQIIFSSYVSGSYNDQCNDIKVDSMDNIYIVGTTISLDLPVKNAAQSFHGGKDKNVWDKDAFTLMLNNNGQLQYLTYLGGKEWDYGNSITVTKSNRIFISGDTSSTEFPYSNQRLNGKRGSYSDVFVIELKNNTSFDTPWFYGGHGTDKLNSSASFCTREKLVFTGYTESRDFPVSEKASRKDNQYSTDAFYITIDFDSAEEPPPPTPPNPPPTETQDYPILLVHGIQFLASYNPIEVWDYMIRRMTGQDLQFLNKKEAYSTSNKEYRKQLVQTIPIDPSEDHYVYKISALNTSYRTVYVVDYNCLLNDKKDPVNSKRNITLSDLRQYATNLKRAISKVKLDSDSDKVNIIAHSMGGLVARTYIEEADFNTDYARSVYSASEDGPRQYLSNYENDIHRLIMIGTPNHGTQFAKMNFLLAPFIPEKRDKYGVEFENYVCVGQMETNSNYLKILNYGKDQNWDIGNQDVLHPEVHYHLIGGIIPPIFCESYPTTKWIEKCYSDSFDRISQKLQKNENTEYLAGYSDGVVPANSCRIYNNDTLIHQNNNLNHIILHSDHSQLINIDESFQIINKLLTDKNETINTEQYWKNRTPSSMYSLGSAFVFSPVTLRIQSGNQTVGFDLPNTTHDAYVDYLSGSIHWYNLPVEQVSYRLEGFDQGTYGVRFTTLDTRKDSQEPIVFESHGLPTTVGQVDTVQINWKSKEYTFESDLNGDGVVDKTVYPPSSPSNLQSKLLDNNSVLLSWQPSQQGTNTIKGYQIYRMGSNEESFSVISFVTSYGAFTYTDLYLDSSQSYVYYVQAVDSHNLSSISSNMSHVSFPVDTPQIVIKLSIGSQYAMVSKEGNDSYVQLDLAPLVKDARTFVPLRFIAEAFGAKVDWYYDPVGESKGRIEITLSRIDGSLLMLKMRDLDPVVHVADYPPGTLTPKTSRYTMDTAPFIVRPQGRTVVPIRFVAECFGAEVEWEANTKTITITFRQ